MRAMRLIFGILHQCRHIADAAHLTRLSPAAEADIDQLCRFQPADIGKAAFGQDRAFEWKLRRKQRAHLSLGRRIAGLVIDNGSATSLEHIDAVGPRAQGERAGRTRKVARAFDLDKGVRDIETPLAFFAHEPA